MEFRQTVIQFDHTLTHHNDTETNLEWGPNYFPNYFNAIASKLRDRFLFPKD